jgi:hypothetical protein
MWFGSSWRGKGEEKSKFGLSEGRKTQLNLQPARSPAWWVAPPFLVCTAPLGGSGTATLGKVHHHPRQGAPPPPAACPKSAISKPLFRILSITLSSELRFWWSMTFRKANEMLYKIDLVVFDFELKRAPPWSPDCLVVASLLFFQRVQFSRVGLGGHRHPMSSSRGSTTSSN